ncbi:hypothetical protein I4552_07380 [Klebsiella michiganensis]|uniref:hypothetical protein n=1 Tax=Klebsiella michiganensis TaxID=1134687 RepID=UPI0018C624CC|nr:hypothetical protein [Klebsiella michiganensis]MBG2619662.1 hypothetical protein [Klebsiella michiganensis]MBG2630809.1 hypothetical protein [Klebsiella michiganensis]
MITRRMLIQSLLISPLLPIEKAISKTLTNKNTIANSYDVLEEMVPSEPGQIVTLKSYHIGEKKGGGIFIAVQDKTKKSDKGTVIQAVNGLSWIRIDSLKKIKKPEWFGCYGDNENDDTSAFNLMLHALNTGDNIILAPNSIYFNRLKTESDEWVITQNNITIIGNNATLSRRATTPNDVDNISTIKIMGANNFKIKGKLLITTNEPNFPLTDTNNNIISNETFPRAYVSSHGLYLKKVNYVSLSKELTCSNAVFPCYIFNCKNLDIKGSYTKSGQVHPFKSQDLQLGSGIKIAKTENFKVRIRTSDTAYCGCEIEPYTTQGNIDLISEKSFMHGCIIHRNSNNMQVNVTCNNAKRAAIQISAGSSEIRGDIYANNCKYGCIITSEKNNICKNIELNIHCTNTKDMNLVVRNSDGNYSSIKNATIQLFFNNINIQNEVRKTTNPPRTPLIKISNAEKCKILIPSNTDSNAISISNSTDCDVIRKK